LKRVEPAPIRPKEVDTYNPELVRATMETVATTHCTALLEARRSDAGQAKRSGAVESAGLEADVQLADNFAGARLSLSNIGAQRRRRNQERRLDQARRVDQHRRLDEGRRLDQHRRLDEDGRLNQDRRLDEGRRRDQGGQTVVVLGAGGRRKR